MSIHLNIFICMFLILFTAKVFGYIALSWWWVIAPLLVPVALLTGIIIVFLTIMIATYFVDK